MPGARELSPLLPVVAVLGLLASLLEGAGIGLFIPLLALMLGEPTSTALPSGLQPVASAFDISRAGSRALTIGAVILAMILLKGIVQAANEGLLVWMQGRLGGKLRSRLADKLLRLNYSFFVEQDRARITHIMATDSWFVLEAARSALAIIPAATALLVFTVLLALLNLRLSIAVVIGAALVQFTLWALERRQKRLSVQFTATYQALWGRLLTIMQAPRVIRLFGQQAIEERRTSHAIEALRRNFVASQGLTASVQPIVDLLLALLFVGVLLAGYRVGMSVPAISAFLLLLTRAQPHARTIGAARLSMASFHGSVREVQWLLAQPTPPPVGDAPKTSLEISEPIQFQEVSYTYPNGTRALDHVDLTIEPGVATALIGHSGSGKTTLVNLLCGLLHPQAGKIIMGDQTIEQLIARGWNRRIALAGQDSELVVGTVLENIAYGKPSASADEVHDAARAAGAEKFIANLPQGYATPIGTDGHRLSAGQRQRIGLARALLVKPDLLILDEATSAVDAPTEAEIMELIGQHRHFRTLLIISHRKATLAACQRGIVLKDGRVSEASKLTELSYFKTMAADPARGGSRDRLHAD